MRFYLSILVLTGLMPAAVLAKPVGQRYTVRHYTSGNGLPQNSVKAIVQDRDHFVWLATDLGLARFDGQSFLTFDKSNLDISNHQVISFARDPEGRNDQVFAFTTSSECIKISNGRAVRSENVMESHFRDFPKNKQEANGWAYSVNLPDQHRGQWAVSHYLFSLPEAKGSFYMWRKGGKIDFYENWKRQKSYATGVLSPFNIFRIGKNLYHDTRRGSIELLTSESSAIRPPGKIRIRPGQPWDAMPDLSKPYVMYSHDLSGKTFIYQGRKLYLVSQDSSGDFRTNVLLENFDFQGSNVISIFFDEKNNRLFLGTFNNGLFIFDFHAFETLTVDNTDFHANIFYSHTAFSDSTVLTPSFSVLGKKKSGQSISYQLPHLARDISMNVNTVLISRTGDMWYRDNYVLYCYDGKSKKLKRKWNTGGLSSQIYEDRAGKIWLGTLADGLLYLDPHEQGAQVHTFTPKLKDIIYLLEEGPDILWVATGKGLFRISRSRKTLSLVPRTGHLRVKSLYITRKGELWFTTVGNGQFLLQGDKLTRLPLDKNKILLTAHCFVGDENGFLWISTNNGLFRTHRKDVLEFAIHQDSTRFYYHRFSKQNGFLIDEFNGTCQPCAVRLHNGYVSLPSINGLVFFKPEQTPVDLPDSKIFIDRIQVDSRDIAVDSSQIELANVSDIQVFVSSPYLGNRENQQLYYAVSSNRRAEPTEIWHLIDREQQSIHLNNLESGTYMLKIRKNGGFGASSERLTALTIVIPYKWYETWLFKTLVVVAAMFAILVYYKNRLKKVTRLNRVLESRVSERTRDLQDTLSVLKTSEAELLRQTRLQMHLIASISHDIRSPLRSIEFTSAKLSGLIDNGEHMLAKTVGSSVNESSKRILTLLENMLSYVRSQFSDSSIVYETFPAGVLVDEVALIFKQAFAVRQNRFENKVPETLQIRSNRQLLKIILHNLIDNANKFTTEGSVTVSAEGSREAITLIVSDTGPGLSGQILRWFNGSDRSYTGSRDDEHDIQGIGLVIVRELAEILRLEVKVVSNSGAEFRIRIGD